MKALEASAICRLGSSAPWTAAAAAVAAADFTPVQRGERSWLTPLHVSCITRQKAAVGSQRPHGCSMAIHEVAALFSATSGAVGDEYIKGPADHD